MIQGSQIAVDKRKGRREMNDKKEMEEDMRGMPGSLFTFSVLLFIPTTQQSKVHPHHISKPPPDNILLN